MDNAKSFIAVGVIAVLCIFGFLWQRTPERHKAWFVCKTHILNDKDWCRNKLR